VIDIVVCREEFVDKQNIGGLEYASRALTSGSENERQYRQRQHFRARREASQSSTGVAPDDDEFRSYELC
jgi:hypothetical protein